MFAARPNTNKKIMIILSDGIPTYSYKPSSVGPINNNEVKAYDYKTPTYLVDGYDYSSRIGKGNSYDLVSDTYKIGDTIISNTGDATIGELVDFKKNDNNKVCSLGIDVVDSPATAGAYEYINTPNFSSVPGVEIKGSWTETVQNGLYDPKEKISATAEYTNTTGTNVTIKMTSNVVQDDDTRPIPAKTRDYVENSGEKIAFIYKNDVLIESLTFDEVMAREKSNITEGIVTLAPGDTYKITTTFTLKDFTLMGSGVDTLNTMHLAQYKYRINSSSSTAFCYDTNLGYKGPILGFHSQYETKAQGEYVLRNLSSTGVINDTYYDVSNIDTLLNVLNNNIYSEITDSIVDGTITDPMGAKHIEFQTKAFNGKDFVLTATKDGISDKSLLNGVKVNYDKKTKTLKVTGLNLSKGEKIFVKYKVKLNIADTDFKYNTWYPTNKRTTLTPYAGATKLDFPIPQVYVEKNQTNDRDSDISKTGTNSLAIVFTCVLISLITISGLKKYRNE